MKLWVLALIPLLVALATASIGEETTGFYLNLNIGPDTEEAIESIFSQFIGSIRTALEPHMVDLRASVEELHREVEERGGIEGLREEAEQALQAFEARSRRAQEGATTMFSSLLDNIESHIDLASSAVRTGLTSVVLGGRGLIRELGNLQPEAPTPGPGRDDEAPLVKVIGQRSRRAVRDRYNNNNDYNKAVMTQLQNYDGYLREMTLLLHDVSFELSGIRHFLQGGGRRTFKVTTEEGKIKVPQKLFSRHPLKNRVKRQAIISDDNVNNNQILNSEVHRYMDKYKSLMAGMTSLLRDIFHEIAAIRRQVI